MKDIESKISPLIASLFPSFYNEEGPNFIAFVKAYYEWLEQNFQLLDLEDITDFNVGDTIQQAEVTGTIYSIDANSVLVHVDSLETFKCFNVCSELIPITSSSGGSTFILRGGTTRRLGTIFLSRNLNKIRDIDKTIDLFVVKFKEKYLKNIEFDTKSNKRLLVKNSLDLYRSKGTARSIDLFFRLLYGTKSSVYYPGDDLFRLSDAEWFSPQYIEINSTSVDRAITLVGKQVTGVNSGATAFIERYVKKKVNIGFVHVFYVSNVRGTFEVREKLKYDKIYSDSPRVLGSLTDVNIISGSELFSVGDLINFDSETGLGAAGRVTATTRGTGEVSFTLANSGWGYTTNRKIDNTAPVTSNTLLSERTLTVSNVVAGQYLYTITPTNGGSGYNNTDVITVSSRYQNGKAAPTTNSTGSIVSIRILDRGVGFYPSAEAPDVTVANSSGLASNGVNFSWSIGYSYPESYFQFLETITQPLHQITYNTSTGIDQISSGMPIEVGVGVNGFGTITSIDKASNTMIISMNNKSNINPGDTITASPTSTVTAGVVTLLEAKGQVVKVIPTGTIEIDPIDSVYQTGDVVYQTDVDNITVASAKITNTAQLLTGGTVSVSDIMGVFRTSGNHAARKLLVLDKPDANSKCSSVSLSVAIDTANTFIDSFAPFVYSSTTGATATVTLTTAGKDADYRIASLENTETVSVNTDRLSNNTILNTRLNANLFNLPFSPSANLSSIVFGALNFRDITIGSINRLGDINPGSGYNRDPFAVPYQPYITGYQARDYVFTVSDNQTSFEVGETITQSNTINIERLFVANTSPFRLGEFVHVANTTADFVANGVILFINSLSNYIEVERPTGNFPTPSAGYGLKSVITTGNSNISSITSNTAVVISNGIVKEKTENKLYVKRIQLKDRFINGTITGISSGTTATVTSIEEDVNSDPAGLNANVIAKASSSEGVISQIRITDSGFGYSNDEELVFTASTDERIGVVRSVKGGVGTGTGYYRSAKGFSSDISSIHDGDYYQEYSYDILSRIPLSKYSSMFKKVMHTAGTRYFGTVLIESLVSNTNVKYANTTIEKTSGSPLTIVDRSLPPLNIQDINNLNIEIRD